VGLGLQGLRAEDLIGQAKLVFFFYVMQTSDSAVYLCTDLVMALDAGSRQAGFQNESQLQSPFAA